MSADRQAQHEEAEQMRMAALLIGKTIETVDTSNLPQYSWPDWIRLRFTDGTHTTFACEGSQEPEGVSVE